MTELKLIQNIIRQYDLGDLISYKKLEEGLVDNKYILFTGKGNFFLRQYPSNKDIDAILWEHSLMSYLHAHGFPVPALIKTQKDEDIVSANGYNYLLQEFLDGHYVFIFSPEQKANMSQDQLSGIFENRCISAASVLAEFHILSKSAELKGKKEPYSFQASIDLIKNGFNGVNSLPKDSRNYTLSSLDNFFSRNLPPIRKLVPVHGDYHHKNVYYKGDNVIGVLDFGLAHPGFEIRDLVFGLLTFSHDPRKHHELIFPKVEQFITGYLKKNPLTFSVDEMMYYIYETQFQIIARILGCPEEFKGNKEMIQQHLFSRIDSIKWLDQNKQELVDTLAGVKP